MRFFSFRFWDSGKRNSKECPSESGGNSQATMTMTLRDLFSQNTHEETDTIRTLAEERTNLALEVSRLLRSRIVERASAKEELSLVRTELECQTRRLEKENTELQLGLDGELDRRSNDWSTMLKKYQSDVRRLRHRTRELAEHNVSLQREVSNLNKRDTENRSKMEFFGQQFKEQTTRLEDRKDENQDLMKNLSELQEKYTAAEEGRICIQKNFEDKEKECEELYKSVTRLQRTCSEQEKTIDGYNKPLEKADKCVEKLQMEQLRLTAVEQSLRRELESNRLEVDSLRHENMNLLKDNGKETDAFTNMNLLKDNGKETDAFTVKLENEMWTRICCLKNQGLSMLNNSSQLNSKLVELVKGRAGKFRENKEGIEVLKPGLDGQFIVESEMRVQGLEHGIESLSRSLQTMAGLLHDKSNLAASNGLTQQNHQTSEDVMRYELKAETLLTSLLREKLFSKEVEVEQLQAELATALRVNDILHCEVQSATDNLSFVSHKLKDLEIQMLKKDENVSHLQNDLEESTKELTVARGILPKISAERDMMWDEVKQYSEMNMLLNSEINVLKKKVESLDEEVLLKEGQITILNDTIRTNRSTF
ncbi:hypothetical protein UlMin_001890 [Ulmus minor]